MPVDIVDARAEAYANRFSTPETPLLAAVAADTQAAHAHAHMLSGHVQGKFLEMVSLLVQPRYILEIGTFTGYSALCLAKGLQKEGELHTIEMRAADAETAQGYFNRSEWKEQIILHTGNALEIIPGLQKSWDLVFIDADKVSYTDYYKLVLPHVRAGGIILADNVLFHGQVLENPVTGKSARAIQAFNEYLQQEESVDKVLLTIRDGLFMIRKK